MPGIGKNIARRRDKENVGALLVELGFHPHAGDLLDIVDEEVEHVLEGMGLDAQVVAVHVTVGHRRGDPVDVQPEQIEQLAAHDGDFGRVDAVGAEHRAAPALGALEQVVPPLLEHIQAHGPGAVQLAEESCPCGVKSLR